MRVAIVNPGIYVYGGAELVIVRLANYLTEQGIANTILTSSIPAEMRAELKSTEVRLVSGKRIPVAPKAGRTLGLEEAGGLRQALKSMTGQFDVVNMHNFPAELASSAAIAPVVWLCNEPPRICLRYDFEKRVLHRLVLALYLKWERRIVRRHVHTAVVADEFNAKRFRDLYARAPQIVPYGIDASYFQNGDASRAMERFGLGGRFIILQVGMLTPFKNQLESVQAMVHLKQIVPESFLVLAGWGEPAYLKQVRTAIRENNLDDDVLITGHIERETVRDLYHSAHVLVHPIKPQGGWLSPFEALSAGLPIVVSPRLTAARIIQDHNLGIVTEDVARGVLEVHQNREAYRDRAAQARDWVKENLSWENFCAQMTGIFHQATGQAQKRKRRKP